MFFGFSCRFFSLFFWLNVCLVIFLVVLISCCWCDIWD